MATTTKRLFSRHGLDNNNNSITNLGAAGSTLTLSGGDAVTFTTTGATSITLPTSGTIATTSTAQTLTNKTVINNAVARNVGATLGTSDIKAGFIYCTPTANITLTAPTGTTLDGLSTTLDDYLDLTIFTTAAFSVTLGTNTGLTILGSAATAASANSFATFRFRRSGSATWVAYRIN